MKQFTFRQPTGKTIANPSPGFVASAILSPPKDYWRQGNGDANIKCSEDGVEKSELIIAENEEFGFYMRFYDYEEHPNPKPWLSLQDRSTLSVTTECCDEWIASVGLFVVPERAAKAVEEFVQTGHKPTSIEWIRPSEIPEDGNY